MLITCWSAKGGVGTTVVASALALLLARQHDHEVLLVDLAGDVPAALGLDAPGPGITGWLDAGPDVPADALARLSVRATPQLLVVPRGTGDVGPLERVEVLASLLAGRSTPVVVDAGTVVAGPEGAAGRTLAGAADHSLLVLRPCFLGLQRALAAPLRPSAVVLVTEPGRALGAADVEGTLHVPVRAEVAVDPSVARAVDAGLLATRLPRPLARSLEAAA